MPHYFSKKLFNKKIKQVCSAWRYEQVIITIDLTSSAVFNWCQGLCLLVQINQHLPSSKDHVCKPPKEAEIFVVFFFLSFLQHSDLKCWHLRWNQGHTLSAFLKWGIKIATRSHLLPLVFPSLLKHVSFFLEIKFYTFSRELIPSGLQMSLGFFPKQPPALPQPLVGSHTPRVPAAGWVPGGALQAHGLMHGAFPQHQISFYPAVCEHLNALYDGV